MILLMGPMTDPVLANVCARFAVGNADLVCALLGTHLGHSHIWFSYGPVFNRLFMSPAHYHPGHPEVLQVGLLDAAPREFETVRSLYVSPFARGVQTLTRLFERRS